MVSVLFCDVVGFTGRSERLDVEDVEKFLGLYHRLLRRELERHGGTVEKFIGDAVMALFGAPVAHEDDAERAVRAALAIQDAVAELRESDIADLHVRVGVTTGEALVALGADITSGEGMATGDVVNSAARLQAAAPIDGVLVAEGTYRATDRAIRYTAADPIDAKGKAEPVIVWRAVEPRSLLPEQSRADDLALVGRGQELKHLVAALERCRGEPSTQLVTIIGAPGIGKSRLVYELFRYLDARADPVRWRRGRSLAYGEGVALWALGEMVKAEAGILESDSTGAAAQKLDEAVAAVIGDARDRDWVAQHLRPLVGLDPGASLPVEGGRVEAFAAWRRFCEALAEDCPTVLVFEDLHWADDALLDFIDLLADRAGAAPLLLVCTARPELLERRTGWSGGKVNAQTILLSPLSDEDTARLVGDMLDQALLPAETQRALVDRAEGNPLYTQEYVRMLRDRNLLVRDRGGWRLVAEPEELPESVQAIIASRLDTLSEDEKQLIRDAAVVGKTAWIGAVCAISERSPWQAEELVHRLERKQLVRRARRSSVAGEVEFGFAHALTQEVAYSQIPRVERAEKHERAGTWIGHLAGERDDKAELLAHHYSTALHLRQQAGDDAAWVAPRALAALVEAGRQAKAVNAHAAAARQLAAALELTPADDPMRPRLLLDHATAAYDAGTSDEVTLRTALDAQVAVGDWEAAAEACMLLSTWFDTYTGHGKHMDEILARGLEYATRDGYTPRASHIASAQTYRLLVTGQSDQVLEFAEVAIRRAEEVGDATGRALLLMWRGAAHATQGDPIGLEEVKAAATILADQNHTKTAAAYHNLAECLVGAGELAAAADARIQAARWAERFGVADQIAGAQAASAESAYHAGDWKTALSLSIPLTDHPAELEAASARWVRGRIVLARGDTRLAQDDATRILDYARRSGNDDVLIYGHALAALAHHATGDRLGTDAAGERFLDCWERARGMLTWAHILAEIAPTVRQPDVLAGAARLLPNGSPWKESLTALADQRYADAAAVYHTMGSHPLEAIAHLLAAGDHNQHNGPSASGAAQHALEFYRQVGATAYAARASRLLKHTA